MLIPPPDIRTRIGLIIPSSNRLTEPQMRRYAPSDVEVHVTRLRMTGASHVPLRELLPRIAEATAALADARCDVIVFHCTASAMEDGVAGTKLVEETMRAAAPQAAVATTASAALAALQALGAKRVLLLSPYAAETHDDEAAFLREAGFLTEGSCCLGLAGSDAYIAVTPDEWFRLAIAQHEVHRSAEVVFLSCTNTHTPQVIGPLESATDCPVLTSNQAVLWYALRLSRRLDSIASLGRLFDRGLDSGLRPGRAANAQPFAVS